MAVPWRDQHPLALYAFFTLFAEILTVKTASISCKTCLGGLQQAAKTKVGDLFSFVLKVIVCNIKGGYCHTGGMPLSVHALCSRAAP
ncbi:hypothetical protein ABMC88_17640 [Sulfitobacter sp. HNIBRBA2951]|uniref:hypothetical protein n=1 Tax=Sulfitobacter aquimarinus TaxID=3158557 RepID=UPI0032DFE0F2